MLYNVLVCILIIYYYEVLLIRTIWYLLWFCQLNDRIQRDPFDHWNLIVAMRLTSLAIVVISSSYVQPCVQSVVWLVELEKLTYCRHLDSCISPLSRVSIGMLWFKCTWPAGRRSSGMVQWCFTSAPGIEGRRSIMF